MTVLPRGDRARRSARRPGWLLLTVLLVLAIVASSALVFTNRVELLKLAVILSLWAAVVGAFVSVIYRRQSDVDAAKARDLKMVYDLQLDREISARREYELNVETHLRRELAHELRAQADDEVAALRAELTALRTSLEILFDTDLAHRPALEHDGYTEWPQPVPPTRPDRVTSSRIIAEPVDEPRTAESPIIDVPEEPLIPVAEPIDYRGSHRRPSEAEQTRWMPPVTEAPAPPPVDYWSPPPPPAPAPPPPPPAEPPLPPLWAPPPPPAPAPQVERRGRHSGAPEPEPAPMPTARHRDASADEPVTGGQSVADLLARLQHTDAAPGGRRRRRED